MKNIKLFGYRASVVEVNEELKGSIVLPEHKHKAYGIGKVIAVGDGKLHLADGSFIQKETCVSVGDMVWYQNSQVMIANNMATIDGTKILTLHQQDLIAGLKSTTVTVEDMWMLGKWVMIEGIDERDSPIVLPETVDFFSDVKVLKFVVVKKGKQVKEVELNDEVIVDKKFINPISINKRCLFYVDSQYIHGIVEK